MTAAEPPAFGGYQPGPRVAAPELVIGTPPIVQAGAVPVAEIPAGGWPEMRDAAYPGGIPEGWTGAVAGYLGGDLAVNVWAPHEWRGFPNRRKLPIWVAGHQPRSEAWTCLEQLWRAGVPPGVRIAVDLETRVDGYWAETFARPLEWAGFKLMVYGSASTVFGNPQLHGYWVADYAGIGPFMYDHPAVRATQYAPGAHADSSTIHAWVEAELWV